MFDRKRIRQYLTTSNLAWNFTQREQTVRIIKKCHLGIWEWQICDEIESPKMKFPAQAPGPLFFSQFPLHQQPLNLRTIRWLLVQPRKSQIDRSCINLNRVYWACVRFWWIPDRCCDRSTLFRGNNGQWVFDNVIELVGVWKIDVVESVGLVWNEIGEFIRIIRLFHFM